VVVLVDVGVVVLVDVGVVVLVDVGVVVLVDVGVNVAVAVAWPSTLPKPNRPLGSLAALTACVVISASPGPAPSCGAACAGTAAPGTLRPARSVSINNAASSERSARRLVIQSPLSPTSSGSPPRGARRHPADYAERPT